MNKVKSKPIHTAKTKKQQQTKDSNKKALYSKKTDEQEQWQDRLYRQRQLACSLSPAHCGQEVFVAGWAMRYRDQGGCVFVDLRDRSGILQLVFDLSVIGEGFETAQIIRSEFVLGVQGLLRQRAPESINPKLETGQIELLVQSFVILNQAQTPPIGLEEHDESSLDLALQNRFLDLRRREMSEIMQVRSHLNKNIRNFLCSEHFLEIETPILNKATPEGARDFLVPSRLNPGRFYALPQSPQIFKQVLMVSGMERYFQIAKCFRDEDLRADRQPEFTQLDLEMSFVNSEMVMAQMEELWSSVIKETFGIRTKRPYLRLSYQEAMEKYGLDAPDLRYDMPLVDIANIGKESQFQVFHSVLEQGGRLKALCVPGGAKLSRKEIDDLTAWVVNDFHAKGLAWMKHESSGLHSVITKFFSPSILEQLAKQCQSKEGDIIFFGAGPEETVNMTLGNLRVRMAKNFKLIPQDTWSFVWIYDFPLFAYQTDNQQQVVTSMHNPFTAPRPEDVDILMDEERFVAQKEKIISQAYDLVLNGVEIGGGSIRINRADMQEKVFRYLGLSEESINQQFGFFLRSLGYGAPPHGGIAFGIDRILMLFLNRDSIRDVIAFPKTQKGQCLFSEMPGGVDQQQLRELGLTMKAKI